MTRSWTPSPTAERAAHVGTQFRPASHPRPAPSYDRRVLSNSVPLLILPLALLGFAALVGLIWWAIFGDADKKRRRCPACWHDLSGTPGLVCGECGHRAASEASLHQPRRRWSLAGLGLVAVLAGASWIHWNYAGARWTDLVPTRVLLTALPWVDANSDLAVELITRMAAGELSPAQLSDLFERSLRGDSSAPPGSPAWERRYAGFLNAWRRSPTFGAPGQREQLWQLPSRVRIERPQPWPTDVPVRAHLLLEEWWPEGAECRVVVRPRDGSGRELIAIRRDQRRSARLPVPIAALPADRESLEVDVVVQRRWRNPIRPPEEELAWEPAGEAVIELSLDDRMAPGALPEKVDTPEMRTALEAVFSRGLVRWPAGARRFGVSFDPTVTEAELFLDTAIGLRVEVLEEGVPRRSSELWWMGGPPNEALAERRSSASRSSAYAWEITLEDGPALDRAQSGDPRWTLRITGVPEIALRAAAFRAVATDSETATPLKCWGGSIEVPLRVITRSGTAPLRTWQIGDPPPPAPAPPESPPTDSE